MFLAIDLQKSGIYVSICPYCLFMPSKLSIRARKISLTLKAAYQLARTLIELGSYDQVKSLVLPLLRQFKPTSESGQSFRLVYAKALYRPAGASRAEVSEAVAIFDDVLCKLQRVLGPSHPETLATLAELDRARMTLEDYLKFKS